LNGFHHNMSPARTAAPDRPERPDNDGLQERDGIAAQRQVATAWSQGASRLNGRVVRIVSTIQS
jgi:hypothetical protein